MRICGHACDRCRVGAEGRTFILLYLWNQRDMLMLFFSFSVSQGSETGLEGGGDGREMQLASCGSLETICSSFHLTGGVDRWDTFSCLIPTLI